MHIFNSIYAGKTIFLTGHTGFKGAWLAHWLTLLGANVVGYSLAPTTKHNLYEILNIEKNIANSYIHDIRDREKLYEACIACKPDVVFHLAAQPLVRLSYAEPIFTYETNVIGTLNVLEAARKANTVKAFVCITTDKCYDNKEIDYAYTEEDSLGGYDMYSSSKACAELLAASYRSTFLRDGQPFTVATARAGNVIGGGDWSQDRLMTDCIESIMQDTSIHIRNPKSIRPWQHVLEPLAGYLRLGQKILEQGNKYAQAYNFGPNIDEKMKVHEVAQMVVEFWGRGNVVVGSGDGLHEATLLQLNNAKAKKDLDMYPVYSVHEAIKLTVDWYKAFYENAHMCEYTSTQINHFIHTAKSQNAPWCK